MIQRTRTNFVNYWSENVPSDRKIVEVIGDRSNVRRASWGNRSLNLFRRRLTQGIFALASILGLLCGTSGISQNLQCGTTHIILVVSLRDTSLRQQSCNCLQQPLLKPKSPSTQRDFRLKSELSCCKSMHSFTVAKSSWTSCFWSFPSSWLQTYLSSSLLWFLLQMFLKSSRTLHLKFQWLTPDRETSSWFAPALSSFTVFCSEPVVQSCPHSSTLTHTSTDCHSLSTCVSNRCSFMDFQQPELHWLRPLEAPSIWHELSAWRLGGASESRVLVTMALCLTKLHRSRAVPGLLNSGTKCLTLIRYSNVHTAWKPTLSTHSFGAWTQTTQKWRLTYFSPLP